MMFHPPLAFFCTLNAAVAGGCVLGVPHHQHRQGLGLPQRLNYGASPSCPELGAQPTDISHICQAAANYPDKAVYPFISLAERHPPQQCAPEPCPWEPFPPCTWQESLAAFSWRAISNPTSQRKQKPVFSLWKNQQLGGEKCLQTCFSQWVVGTGQGRVVRQFPFLSQAQAAPGSTWRFAGCHQPRGFNPKQPPPCVPAWQPNRSMFTSTGFGSLAGHQHNSPVTLSFVRQVLTAMAQGGREQGHSYLYWRREPSQLLQQLDFAVQLRKLQDTLCLAVQHPTHGAEASHGPTHTERACQGWKGSAPAPCLLPDTLGWTRAQGIHTLPEVGS